MVYQHKISLWTKITVEYYKIVLTGKRWLKNCLSVCSPYLKSSFDIVFLSKAKAIKVKIHPVKIFSVWLFQHHMKTSGWNLIKLGTVFNLRFSPGQTYPTKTSWVASIWLVSSSRQCIPSCWCSTFDPKKTLNLCSHPSYSSMWLVLLSQNGAAGSDVGKGGSLDRSPTPPFWRKMFKFVYKI